MTASVQDTLAQQRIDALLLRVTALETAVARLLAGEFTAGTLDIAVLKLIDGQLDHQSDTNTTLDGVLTWSDNLTDGLIAKGYMKSS